MWIRCVTAESFGPFKGQTLELARGLTVVCGSNESAKSSWHAALYAAVCGRRRSKGAMSREERRFAELHRPWDGGGWEVSCVLELADGRVVELRHDLDGRVDCRAIDRATGADVSREIITDGSPDAARWLGLDRRSFASTASVTQTELLAVLAAAEGLQGHLQRAAATAGADDGTAAAALERLDRYAREQIGADRVGSAKPLRRALEAVAAAQRQLATAREAHEAYLGAEAVARAARASAERAAELAAQAARRHATLQRAAALQAESDLLRAAVETAEDRVVESAQAVGALRHRHVEAAQLQQTIDAADALDDVSPQQVLLPTGEDGDVLVAADVAALATEFELAQAVGRRHRESRPAAVSISDGSAAAAVRVGPSSLRDLAARVEALTALIGEAADGILTAGAPQLLTVRRVGLLACAVVALVGVVLAGFGEVLPGVVLLGLAVGAVAWAGRRRASLSVSALVPAGLAPLQVDAAREQLRAVADSCRRLGVPASADELRRWAAHAERIADQEQEWLRWELDSQEHESLIRDLGQRLCARIADRDPDSVAGHPRDPERCLSSYRQRCADRSAMLARSARRVYVQRSRLQMLLDGESLAALHRRLCDAEDRHRELVRLAGERTEALEATLSAAQRAWAAASVTDGDVAELTAAVGAAEPADHRAARDPREMSEARDLSAVVSDAARAAERANASAMSMLDEAGRCEGAARHHSASVLNVAEAEERLAAAEAQLAALRQAQRTVSLTRDFLSRAQERIHRDIAPVLARTLTERLPEITAGRYVEALVDPASLRVQVCGPDRRWRTADRLSVGTAEQIYLLLRIALATSLCAPGETCPLLLDDVTVQADAVRTVAILEMLLAEAASRQIVLFAQEPLVARWAAERVAGDDRHAVVTLPAPA